jgi:hypothetical protein
MITIQEAKTTASRILSGRDPRDLTLLYDLWKRGDDNPIFLVVAALFMLGAQQLSPVSALSAAISTQETVLFETLFHLGKAISAVRTRPNSRPAEVFQQLAVESYRAAAHIFLQKASSVEE